MDVLLITIPLFAVILAGYLSVRLGYVAGADVAAVSRLVARVAVPALIFRAVTQAPLEESINAGFLAAYLAASLGAFALALARARLAAGAPTSVGAMQALGSANSNSAFMGYPVAAVVVGAAAAAAMLAECMLVENMVIIPLALALAEMGSGGREHWRSSLRTIALGPVRSPIVLALLAGLLVSGLGWTLPDPVARAVALLASAAAPMALFVIGGSVAGLAISSVLRPVGWIVLFKLVVHPALVAAAMAAAPGIDATTFASGLIFGASPMLTIYPVLGQRCGMQGVAATALIVAVMGSFITLNAVIFLVTRGGLT